MSQTFAEFLEAEKRSKGQTFEAFLNAEKSGGDVLTDLSPDVSGSALPEDDILGRAIEAERTEIFDDKLPPLQIPRFLTEGRNPDIGGTALVNLGLGGAELLANLLGFALGPAEDVARGAEMSEFDMLGPEGQFQVPPVAEAIVDPAAKLAAGVTTKDETQAGRELFEEAKKEAIEHPEGLIMPFLIAAGGREAAKPIGRVVKAIRGRRGGAIPEVEPTILSDLTEPTPKPKPRVFKDLADLGEIKEEFPTRSVPARPKMSKTLESVYDEAIEGIPNDILKDINVKSIRVGEFSPEISGEGGQLVPITPAGSKIGTSELHIALEAGDINLANTLRHELLHAYVFDKPELAGKGFHGHHKAVLELEARIDSKVTPGTETLESTLAVRTEAAAIEKKLTTDFGDLSQYETMNMAEQARRAQDIIAKDYEQAKRMAMGDEPPPAGLREASIYEGVKLRALAEGDVQTLMELATESKIPTKLTEYGQAIKAADSEIINDPVRTMQSISEVRKQRAERTGKKSTDAEIGRLRTELETLQKALDERVTRTKRTPVKYGSRNKIVDQTVYDNAKLEINRTISQLGANPFANPKVIAEAIKIGTYHLEAGTRAFADWSARMVTDLGEQVKPELENLWKKINEDKKLRTALKAQKTRLARETETLTGKLEDLDLTKPERRKLPFDKEAKELKRKRDVAKANLQAATDVSGTITKVEAQNIVRLSKIADDALVAIEKGGDPLDYGIKFRDYENYVRDLKEGRASIRAKLGERGREFKTTSKEHSAKAVADVGKDAFDLIMDTSIAMKASWDNSFLGRQGWNTLMTHEGIWAKAANKSFTDIAKTLGNKTAHDALMAEIYSRENFRNGNYQKARLLTRTEEEVPTSLPGRIPILGRGFKAAESGFTGSGIRMRTGLFDKWNEWAKEAGVDVTSKAHLEDMGTLINSLTARGKLGKLEGSRFIRIAMWAPKMLKGNWDVLTAHHLGAGLQTPWARKRAAINLTKIVAKTAALLAVADALIPGSVEKDSKSSAFGAIKIGDTYIDVTGGKKSIVILAMRMRTNERKNLAGEVREYSGEFARRSRFDAASDFLINKTPPPTRVVVDWLRDRTFEGDPFTIPGAIEGVTIPITVEQAIDLNDNASADRVAGVILDALGTSSFSVDDDFGRRKKAKIPFLED